MVQSSRMQVYFICHGAGPWPWVAEMQAWHAQMADALRDIPRQLGRRPRAVLLISAHWEEPVFTVQSAQQPGMLYDYGGFPAHTYQVQYRSPGSPALAQRVERLLEQGGIAVRQDGQRGYDHGMFAPMQIIYPEAQVPVVQLSLRSNLNAAEHLAMGRALAALRDEEVLIIGSGASYHNMRTFGTAGHVPSKRFDDWLAQTMLQTTPAERSQRLADWESAPGARTAHPREEHLLPLMVVVGAAQQDAAQRVYFEERFMESATLSSYCLGAVADKDTVADML
ncbi:class III extradiol ring-cleavage dioxygenase [Comamonas sp. lk]|uniref:DODA-type extradiol aromatic ring-opening family dioxygenase n=1 Tax=Comamonas sp. lk TaxID=2201272 RepID=UPI000EB2D637|nr:class III extradiol ring-cleavage dioxygenase [Comamonas sp. lk]